MDTYLVGSEREQWFDATHAGDAVEPTGVTITVTDPQNNVTTPEVKQTGSRYTAIVPITSAGTWRAECVSDTGEYVGVGVDRWRALDPDETP